ncbi:MAG TPA: hypothetical protein VGW09_09580 [Nitrososphaeraceae archaeon]|nr:hypothetical protein [Nitrososphaeraceae archaeon]
MGSFTPVLLKAFTSYQTADAQQLLAQQQDSNDTLSNAVKAPCLPVPVMGNLAQLCPLQSGLVHTELLGVWYF